MRLSDSLAPPHPAATPPPGRLTNVSDMDSEMTTLPFEMIEEILLRIPARSLIPLKLVCKKWGSLISDPRFIRNHTTHALLDKGNLRHRVVGRARRLPGCAISSQAMDYQQLNLAHFKLSFPSIESDCFVIGSCNGLLLMGNSDFTQLFLWNPLFRDNCRILPPRNLTSSSRSRGYVGLGYVSSADDYTVVALSGENECSTELQAEIYSLKSDSWRIIPTTIPYTPGLDDPFSGKGTHVDGSMHWIVYQCETILSFDLATGEYKFTETPRDYIFLRHFRLVEFRGRLGAYQSGRLVQRVMMWTWKKGRWSRSLVIPTKGYRWIQCLHSLSKNEVLLNMFHHPLPGDDLCSKFVVWDVKHKTFRNIPSAGISTFGLVVHMVETIVSPIIGDGRKP